MTSKNLKTINNMAEKIYNKIHQGSGSISSIRPLFGNIKFIETNSLDEIADMEENSDLVGDIESSEEHKKVKEICDILNDLSCPEELCNKSQELQEVNTNLSNLIGGLDLGKSLANKLDSLAEGAIGTGLDQTTALIGKDLCGQYAKSISGISNVVDVACIPDGLKEGLDDIIAGIQDISDLFDGWDELLGDFLLSKISDLSSTILDKYGDYAKFSADIKVEEQRASFSCDGSLLNKENPDNPVSKDNSYKGPIPKQMTEMSDNTAVKRHPITPLPTQFNPQTAIV